jgi:hypothetical protein
MILKQMTDDCMTIIWQTTDDCMPIIADDFCAQMIFMTSFADDL